MTLIPSSALLMRLVIASRAGSSGEFDRGRSGPPKIRERDPCGGLSPKAQKWQRHSMPTGQTLTTFGCETSLETYAGELNVAVSESGVGAVRERPSATFALHHSAQFP